jgi:hypothetical protein
LKVSISDEFFEDVIDIAVLHRNIPTNRSNR